MTSRYHAGPAVPWFTRGVGALVAALTLLLTGCGDTGEAPVATAPTSSSGSSSSSPTSGAMPDVVGLPSVEAATRLAEFLESIGGHVGQSWETAPADSCDVRPGTVGIQRPEPGTPSAEVTEVEVFITQLDLAAFRGPCDVPDSITGAAPTSDLELARAFYRFAADPDLGAPFAPGPTWIGIQDGGPAGTRLAKARRGDLAAWRIGTDYAERSGPFSALDVLAASGGWFQVAPGISPTCPGGNDDAPAELAEMRAVSLTAPDDVVGACLDWWGVTLFLDDADRIGGVALRLGSP